MEMKLWGTCYSQVTPQQRGFRAVMEVGNEFRLTRRWFTREEQAVQYGRRLFYRLREFCDSDIFIKGARGDA